MSPHQAILYAGDTWGTVYHSAIRVTFSKAVGAQAQSFVGRFRQHLSKQLWWNLCFYFWWFWSVVDDSRDIYMSFKLSDLHCIPCLWARCCGSIMYCLFHVCMPGVLRALGAVCASRPQSLTLEQWQFPTKGVLFCFLSQPPQPLCWAVGNGG